MRHAVEVVHDLRVRLPLRLRRLLLVGVQVINARDAIEIVERQRRFAAQVAAHFQEPIGRHFDPRIDVLKIRAGDLPAKLRLQLVNKRGARHF
jgi:hypothetical protein